MSQQTFIPRSGKIVVFDTEFTSWPGFMAAGFKQPGRYPEIIQLGAVKLDAANGFTEVDAMEIYVIPKHNPVLSEYIIDLTGISQETLDTRGMPFPDALSRFLNFLGDETSVLVSFGVDDQILLQNCALNELSAPPLPKPLNVRKELISRGKVDRTAEACGLPALLGFELTGREHTGLADARAVGTAIKLFCNEGVL